MVEVTVYSRKGRTVGFTMRGHANRGEYGSDIVCAAISAVSQTAILGITDVLKSQAGIVCESGNCSCILRETATAEETERAAIIFDTMVCGLKSIRESDPKALKFSHRED